MMSTFNTFNISVLFCVLIILPNFIKSLEWYDTQVLYQIYPKSFKDSGGDGIGDLKGITSQASYFKQLGVGAVWLSPIFKSPMKDNGYDVSDYTSISEIFGTKKDLKAMIKAFHDLGIKVLLDLVPNHTSEEHPWFQDSIAKKNGKEDYYLWVDPDKQSSGGQLMLPNNWLSMFGGSAWTYNEVRKQYYLHQFGSYQPDLNYRNPKVVDEIKNVMRYWLDEDVDGFRVDAVPYLFEDKNLAPDSQIKGCDDLTKYDCFLHDKTKDQPETFALLEELGKVFEEDKYKNKPRKLFLEAYTSLNNTLKYYSKHATPFNFNLLQLQRDWNATQIENLLKQWTDVIPKENRTIWVTGNHDNSRIGSKMGEAMIDAVNMLLFMAPGNSASYYGEEIGMVDTHLRANEMNDSRDPERTPMQWNTNQNAGFSNATKTWLPVNPNYWLVNKETEEKDKKSHLSVYKSLVQLQNDIIQDTNYTTHVITPYVFALKRSNHLLVINLDDIDQQVNLTKVGNLPSSMRVRITSQNAALNEGDTVDGSNLWLRPRSGIIFRIGNSAIMNNGVCLWLLFTALCILNFY